MGKLVPSTLIAMGIFAWSGYHVDAQEATERVILADGEVYEVRTMNGVPIGASDENATIVGLGPAVTTSVENSQWFVEVELHKTGHFIVHVTSYVDKEAAATFSCDGPGRVTQTLFRNKEYPSMWQWLDEPGNSWVPFIFRFSKLSTGEAFELTQWTKFGSQVKRDVQRALQHTR